MDLPGIDLLPYQQAALNSPSRLNWYCWARQTGKSFTLSLRRLVRGLARRRNQIILSAGQRQSREVMQKLRQHCHAMKIYSELKEERFFADASILQLELSLPGGGRIIGLPANPMTARGYTGDIFLDEFAMHRDDEGIWSALLPTLLRSDGELDVASTPRGQSNTFYTLRENPSFAHSTLSLQDAVAQGLRADPAAMRATMGDEVAWRQEFCCEFVDEATAFLTYDMIRQCQDIRLAAGIDWNALERRGAEIYAGVDVGRWHDLTAIWLWERIGDERVTRGVECMQGAPFLEQQARLEAILEKRAVRRCCIDASGIGAQLAEQLTARFGDDRVGAVNFTAALKSELAGRLRVCAERGLLRIPVDERIVSDWHSVSRTVTRSGHVRFDARRSGGAHADRFWAAALGLHAASEAGGDFGFQLPAAPLFARSGIW